MNRAGGRPDCGQRAASTRLGLSGDDTIIHGATQKSHSRAVVAGRVRVVRDDYSGSITRRRWRPCLQEQLLECGLCCRCYRRWQCSDEGLLNIDGDRASRRRCRGVAAPMNWLFSAMCGASIATSPTLKPALWQRGVPAHQLETGHELGTGPYETQSAGRAGEALEGGVSTGDYQRRARASNPVQQALAGQPERYFCR